MTTRKFLRLGLIGLGLLGAGCGQTSYFSVDVIVSGATGRQRNSMAEIKSVQVTTSGAISDESSFLLQGFPRPDNYVYPTVDGGQINIGRFEYGTGSDSGKVTFNVQVKDGSLNTLASGSADGTIKSGANVAMSVTVDPVDSWK
ncbi:MAG TPA: hypothetical protein VIU64_22765 [Polyangia bacterium]